MHRIVQHANSGDGNFNRVAGGEGADAGGCAGGDHVARHQSHHAGKPADQKLNRIDHQGGAAGLLYHTVQASFHERVARIELRLNVGPHRAETVEALGAGELHIAFLQIASGNVVEAGVAEDTWVE